MLVKTGEGSVGETRPFLKRITFFFFFFQNETNLDSRGRFVVIFFRQTLYSEPDSRSIGASNRFRAQRSMSASTTIYRRWVCSVSQTSRYIDAARNPTKTKHRAPGEETLPPTREMLPLTDTAFITLLTTAVLAYCRYFVHSKGVVLQYTT